MVGTGVETPITKGDLFEILFESPEHTYGLTRLRRGSFVFGGSCSQPRDGGARDASGQQGM